MKTTNHPGDVAARRWPGVRRLLSPDPPRRLSSTDARAIVRNPTTSSPELIRATQGWGTR